MGKIRRTCDNSSMNNDPLVYVPKKGPNATKTAKQKKKGKMPLVLDILSIILVAGATYAIFRLTAVKPENREENNPAVVSDLPSDEDDLEKPDELDLSNVVREWASHYTFGPDAGIKIYDLDKQRIVAELNPYETYNSESLYKLFVAYKGYQMLDTGELSAETTVAGQTLKTCLDRMIRESYSPCAEALIALIGASNLDNIIRTEYGIPGSSVVNYTTNASDMVDMMRIYYAHDGLSNENVAQLKDSMLNQPNSNPELTCGTETYGCAWRGGLPSGFTKAKVYNKVGWSYNGSMYVSYHDVAIVEFSEFNRHFAIALLTKNFADANGSKEFGAMVEAELLHLLEQEAKDK